MEKKIIQFKGMSNVPDDQVAQDGQMAILMNAQIKNGEIVPTRADKEISLPNSMSTIKKAKFHDDRLLELNSNGELKVLVGGETPACESKQYDEGLSSAFQSVKVDNFEVMGNVVVLYGGDKETDVENAYFVIWGKDRYEFLGPIPAPPEMKIKTKLVLEKTAADSLVSVESSHSTNNNNKWPFLSKGYFDRCLDLHYRKGRFIDNALFIVGIKLFDNSYIYSHLYLLRETHSYSGADNFTTIVDYNNNDLPTLSHVTVVVSGYEVDIEFDYDFSKWKDIIVSVDVFTSGSLMEHEVTKESLYTYSYNSNSASGLQTYDLGEAEIYTLKSIPQLRDEIETCASFYKFKSYGLKGVLEKKIENSSPSSLSVQDKLPYDNIKSLVNCRTFVYNNRLHVWDYKMLYPTASNGVYKSLITGSNADTELKDSIIEFDDCVIKNKIRIPKSNYNFSPIISHPTRGVKRQVVSKAFDVEFKENPLLDMSVVIGGDLPSDYFVTFKFISMLGDVYENKVYNYYVSPYLDVETFLRKINYKEGLYKIMYLNDYLEVNGVEEKAEFSNYGINGTEDLYNLYASYALINVVKKKTNHSIKAFEYDETVEATEIEKKRSKTKKKLLISATDNPLSFPTEQTHQFEGDITGVSTNIDAISQGQFGQYPLFVFTTEGIWAMQVDSTGKTAYSSQVPYSREVATGAIVPFNKGVAFTTEKGVMAITGSQVVELSETLDAPVAELLEYSGELVEKIFKRVNEELTSVEYVKPVEIREYLKDAGLGYYYAENEIVLFNPLFEYVFVYNLKQQTWTMREGGYMSKTDNLSPQSDLVMYSGSGIRCVFGKGDKAKPIVAITRPIKTDSFDYKRLRQAALRTTFKGSLNFYVLGSNDGANFVCITGKEYPSKNGNEPTDVMRRDLVTSMSRSRQYKYFAIAIAGNMEGRISMAELLMDAGFANNQLR